MAKTYIYTLRVTLRDEADPEHIAFPVPLEENGEKDSHGRVIPVIEWDIMGCHEEKEDNHDRE